eukprot:m.41570 g.41570  ORF g.41570 m.41570 type:complete len:201 (+) comp10582_c0_seq1:276-878(+)
MMLSWCIAALLCVVGVVVADSMTKVGNDGSKGLFSVKGVGGGAFNPSRMSAWTFDARWPLIAPKPNGNCRNIYAANVVNNGDTTWNVYFGGWDGVNSCHDSISVTVTPDGFQSFHSHTPQVATGADMHVNNPSVLKANESTWAMVYTQLPLNSAKNKPGISTSANGVDWTPSAGGEDWINVTDYPFSWEAADVNGATCCT